MGCTRAPTKPYQMERSPNHFLTKIHIYERVFSIYNDPNVLPVQISNGSRDVPISSMSFTDVKAKICMRG